MKHYSGINSRKGQSLIELGVFSAIILLAMGFLVSYGLSYSHNQRIATRAFKRAEQLSKDLAATSRSTSITLVYDKSIADPSSMFGFSQKTPLSFSTSLTASNLLYALYSGDPSGLPRFIYDINGKVYSLTTSAFVDREFDSRTKFDAYIKDGPRRKVYKNRWNPSMGNLWKYETPGGDNKVEEGTSWDINNDDREEAILESYEVFVDKNGRRISLYERGGELNYYFSPQGVFGRDDKGQFTIGGTIDPDNNNVYGPDKTFWGRIKRVFKYLDTSIGELNFNIDDPNLRNGLLSDTKTFITENSAMVNSQDGRIIKTKTSLNNMQIIERRIRLNSSIDFNMYNINVNERPDPEQDRKIEQAEDIRGQIRKNNASCNYNSSPIAQPFGTFRCSDFSEDSSCDCLLEEAGQKYLIVKSKFTDNKSYLEWSINN